MPEAGGHSDVPGVRQFQLAGAFAFSTRGENDGGPADVTARPDLQHGPWMQATGSCLSAG